MIASYYPSSKNTHNLKDMEFIYFLKFKVFFKNLKFQDSFTTCNGV